MPQYVAFLRGINVGGKHLVRMDALRALFASLGLQNVSTYIQSGNVIFEAAAKNPAALTETIEQALLNELGYPVSVVIRTRAELAAIIQLDPFKKTKGEGTPHVTFLSGELKRKIKTPLWSPANDCAIVHVGPREIFTIGYRLPNGRAGNFMALIEKEAGKSLTTRNWNTLTKIVELMKTEG